MKEAKVDTGHNRLTVGRISDGCSSVTHASNLAHLLDGLKLSKQERQVVNECLAENDVEEDRLAEVFDEQLDTLIEVAQRYLPTTHATLVLLYGRAEKGHSYDAFFGILSRMGIDKFPDEEEYGISDVEQPWPNGRRVDLYQGEKGRNYDAR